MRHTEKLQMVKINKPLNGLGVDTGVGEVLPRAVGQQPQEPQLDRAVAFAVVRYLEDHHNR